MEIGGQRGPWLTTHVCYQEGAGGDKGRIRGWGGRSGDAQRQRDAECRERANCACAQKKKKRRCPRRTPDPRPSSPLRRWSMTWRVDPAPPGPGRFCGHYGCGLRTRTDEMEHWRWSTTWTQSWGRSWTFRGGAGRGGGGGEDCDKPVLPAEHVNEGEYSPPVPMPTPVPTGQNCSPTHTHADC